MVAAFLRAWRVALACLVVAVLLGLMVRVIGGPRAGAATWAIEGAILWYAGACWKRPFRDCWCCDGTGKHYREKDGKRVGKTFKRCWWCKGTSSRLRIGRRIYNHFEQARRAGK